MLLKTIINFSRFYYSDAFVPAPPVSFTILGLGEAIALPLEDHWH